MNDLRAQIIASVLGHFSNDYLRRICRTASTDREAAKSLRMSVDGGVGASWGSWRATRKGVAWCGPGARPRAEEGAEVIPWIEIARTARTHAEQLSFEVSL